MGVMRRQHSTGTRQKNSDVKPLYLPPLYQDSIETGRLILRDGTTASIRPAQVADQDELTAFHKRLSAESRWQRFFSQAEPDQELLSQMCDSSQPARQLTLVATRIVDGQPRIIAAGSYFSRDQNSAEVAFAVDDEFQGKGLGTLLLERLALLAARHGFIKFWAMTHPQNRRMIDIFEKSGFPVHSSHEDGYLAIDFAVTPTKESVARSEMLDRIFTTASLRTFFYPQSVAVIGASRNPTSIGYRILEALVSNHFQGPVYPINPQASYVGSIVAYPSLLNFPDSVDLAVIVVPAVLVEKVVDECAQKNIRSLVVITAGFAEIGPEGRKLQQRLLEKVRGYGMRMVGPNCMGMLNTHPEVSLNASFSPIFPQHGRVAMSSQSGALGIAILRAARERGLGLSSFVSVGNKADVSGNDLLQYWEEDPDTDVVLIYLESFGNPRRFSRIARRVGRSKPIVVVKGGRSSAGMRAAGSHTAALAGSDTAVDALFKQTGVIRAETLEEMFDLASALGSQPLPKGKRIAILTNAGGPGILCTDACEAGGLDVPELDSKTTVQLAKFLPASASLKNPVDMIASAGAEEYRQATQVLMQDPEIDGVIIIYIPIDLSISNEVLKSIADAITTGRSGPGSSKTVMVCLMGDRDLQLPLEGQQEKIPSYTFPESAARVMAKVAAYAGWRKEPLGVVPDFNDIQPDKIRQLCSKVLNHHGDGWLSGEEIRDIFRWMNLPVVSGGVATTPDDAVQIAKQTGFPVAVKLASRKILHKTELDLVRLNVRDESEVRDAFRTIQDRVEMTGNPNAMDGVLIQPMMKGGVEVMVGMIEDPLFGPLISFGLGGIHVEILRDVSFRITPLTDKDAAAMIRSIQGYRLLEGYRGHPPGDVSALEQLLLRVSRLVEEVHEIRELDLNPVFAFEHGCAIVDARIRISKDPVRVSETPQEKTLKTKRKLR